MRRYLLVVSLLTAGCVQDDFADLRQFMDQAGRDTPVRVEPLPPLKPMDTFVYQAAQHPDPFTAGSLRPGDETAQGAAGALGQALEDYPLESLRVAGIIQKGGAYHALIATPENRLYLAKRGDRIGQNRGVIIAVNNKGIEISERVRNSLGQWVESKTSLLKQQDGEAKAATAGRSGN